jgi:hypothetical protein
MQMAATNADGRDAITIREGGRRWATGKLRTLGDGLGTLGQSAAGRRDLRYRAFYEDFRGVIGAVPGFIAGIFVHDVPGPASSHDPIASKQ